MEKNHDLLFVSTMRCKYLPRYILLRFLVDFPRHDHCWHSLSTVFLSEVDVLVTCDISIKSSAVSKNNMLPNLAKFRNTFVRAVLKMFLKCLPAQVEVACWAMNNVHSCRCFFSRILTGSIQADICLHEVFLLIMLCW